MANVKFFSGKSLPLEMHKIGRDIIPPTIANFLRALIKSDDSLSSIDEHPQRLRRLMRNPTTNDETKPTATANPTSTNFDVTIGNNAKNAKKHFNE